MADPYGFESFFSERSTDGAVMGEAPDWDGTLGSALKAGISLAILLGVEPGTPSDGADDSHRAERWKRREQTAAG